MRGARVFRCGPERLAPAYVGDRASQGVVRPVDQHVGRVAQDEIGGEGGSPFGEAVPQRYRAEELREPFEVEGMAAAPGGVAHEPVDEGGVLVEAQKVEHGPLEARRRQPVDHHDVGLVERASQEPHALARRLLPDGGDEGVRGHVEVAGAQGGCCRPRRDDGIEWPLGKALGGGLLGEGREPRRLEVGVRGLAPRDEPVDPVAHGLDAHGARHARDLVAPEPERLRLGGGEHPPLRGGELLQLRYVGLPWHT